MRHDCADWQEMITLQEDPTMQRNHGRSSTPHCLLGLTETLECVSTVQTLGTLLSMHFKLHSSKAAASTPCGTRDPRRVVVS